MESALSLDVLSAACQGFGHELRIRMLVLMDRGEQTPTEIASALGEPLGVVSYHMRMLRDYGLVQELRTEPRRGALAHFYERTPVADTVIRKLNGLLDLPNVGRGSLETRREMLAEWALQAKPVKSTPIAA